MLLDDVNTPRSSRNFARSRGKEEYWSEKADLQQMAAIVMANAKPLTRSTSPALDEDAFITAPAALDLGECSMQHLLYRSVLERPVTGCVVGLIISFIMDMLVSLQAAKL